MDTLGALHTLFGGLVSPVLVKVVRTGIALTLRKEFNNLAKAIPGANPADDDIDTHAWISIRLAQDEMSDFNHSFATKIYQQEFVKILRAKKDLFLEQGRGETYINGILQSLLTKVEDDDLLAAVKDAMTMSQVSTTLRSTLKGECISTALGEIMFDFADDAYDKKVNERNDKLASAYVLNMIEAYPVLDGACFDNLRARMRGVLERAMKSDLIAPILKDELKRNYDLYAANATQADVENPPNSALPAP